MSSKKWDITPKKGKDKSKTGAGNVTEEEKNSIINKAISKWKVMGLSREEIALGIATMNVESGFNQRAKGPSVTEKGLGQFNDPTWKDAVKEYNDNHRAQGEPKLDPDSASSQWNTDDQIKVMGAWLEYVHDRAVEKSNDPRLKGYSINEIAYALWHKGAYAKIDSVGEDTGVKEFLDKEFNARKEFKDTYNKVWEDMLTGQDANAADGMPPVEDVLTPGVMDRVMNILFPSFTEPYSVAGAALGGSLERDAADYRRVWRIEPDGSTRGSFMS
ncbi:MAG: hypothetical protein HZB21_00635 [Deltaproteobacteria bacterium]|nr:hypothetical protein [Deltaproteobacteria bacterium]MBI5809691.1 hypothetical protein [Deltaproteobacteria bacterium]